MISRIVDFCVKERLIVLLVTIAAVVFGYYSFRHVPIDAIPNVGENQVIVLTEWSGRSPKDIEDQITYPLSVALQSVAGAESVRGKSMFGFSFVQVTFADDVDFYWARSRVAEQLSTIGNQLPENVSPVLAPDATALGQIFYYVLEPPPGMGLAELRTKQDYVVKYALQSVEGVAEVASIGGYQRQYQIEVDPNRLRFYKLTMSQVIGAVRDSNIDVGAKTIESSGMEYLVRGIGFIGAGKDEAETVAQIEETVVATRENVPISIGDIAEVQIGPCPISLVFDPTITSNTLNKVPVWLSSSSSTPDTTHPSPSHRSFPKRVHIFKIQFILSNSPCFQSCNHVRQLEQSACLVIEFARLRGWEVLEVQEECASFGDRVRMRDSFCLKSNSRPNSLRGIADTEKSRH